MFSFDQNYSQTFTKSMNRLRGVYPQSVFASLGLSDRDFDLSLYTDKFTGAGHSDNIADGSIDDNANVAEHSISQYMTESVKSFHKLNSIYCLYRSIEKNFSTEDADRFLEAFISGSIFLNDSCNTHTSYCFAFDLRNLIFEGMTFFKGVMKIQAPRRTSTFISHIEQMVSYISNQITGACSFPDFFVVYDWFLRKEFGDDYMERLCDGNSTGSFKRAVKKGSFEGLTEQMADSIRNYNQRIIYSLNFPFRGGAQSSFTNLSVLDRGFLKALFTKDGMSGLDYTYPDFTKINIESVLKLSKFFFEQYTEMNGREGYFTFPVMTLALSVSDNAEEKPIKEGFIAEKDLNGKHLMDEETFMWALEANREKFLANVFLSKTTAFSSCCRLKNDFSKLSANGFQNSFGVGGVNIGSHRVCGLNLARMGFLEKYQPKIVDDMLDIIHKTLFSHRMMVEENIKAGVLPLYKYKWINLHKQYSTVGFIGHREYLLNKGLDPKSDEGITAGLEILKKIESQMLSWQNQPEELEHHCVYNLEQIPGESMAVRLANIDRILGYNNDYDLYSNQYLSLYDNESIYERLRIQGTYDGCTSGGSILHISYDDDRPMGLEQYKKVVLTAIRLNCQYFAMNRVFAECPKCGARFNGKHECSACGNLDVNYFTRVVGYLVPVSSWSKTRREKDFPNRFLYNNDNILE